MKKSLFILSFFFLSMASTVYGQAPSSGSSELLVFFVIGIIIFLGVLFLIRELVCWYWKINRRIELQEKTLETMLYILEEQKKNNKLHEIKSIEKTLI